MQSRLLRVCQAAGGQARHFTFASHLALSATHDHDKLSNVLPPYTTVMALVAPPPWWRASPSGGRGGGASAARPQNREQWAWATSDPYLGAVEAWGTADIDRLASLLNLARERRVGGILMSAHRLDKVELEVLERDWVKVGNQLAGHAAPARTLQGVHQGTVESAAKCDAGRVVQGEGHVGAAAASHAQGLVLSVYHFSGDWSLEDWSAIQGWEVDEWMEHEGDPSTPMGGAAAIQLQSWLDDVNGGWPNSFA